MVHHVIELEIEHATAEQIYDFMISPNDEQYHQWWPEEHRQFHITKPGSKNHLGDEVYFDENLGTAHRLAFHAKVRTAHRPHTIVWQMKKGGVRLPAFLELTLRDSLDGLKIRHELKIGYASIPGKLLDPLIRLYFNQSFQRALEMHGKAEWPKLASLLKTQAT